MSETKEEVPVVVEEQLSPSETAKKLGNDAFLAKKYDEAISHYTEAIKLEPENAVYYSNRSACYASLKNWQKAFEDALTCISKDAKFVKGYYRLSSAQTELGMYDDAETTLKAALALEPENEVVVRQLKALKNKRAAAANAKLAKKVAKQLDETQMKELMEIQEQTNVYNRDLRAVRSRLAALQRDTRVNAVTTNQIESLDPKVPLYRSVGKAFVLTGRKDVESRLEREIGELTKSERDLTDRQEYLERRIASNNNNLKDLTSGL